MVVVILIILGLSLGSFINAFVWRFSQKKNFVSDRSECTSCHHKLSGLDLVPVFSWLFLRGKCRYCRQRISIQYPLVELAVMLIFVLSYIFWPFKFSLNQDLLFSLWLLSVFFLSILALYDLKWMILPTKLIYLTYIPVIATTAINILISGYKVTTILNFLLGMALGGGLFFIIYHLSKGQWIGGGDVRLGFLLGLIAGSIEKSLLLIFLAAIIGTLVAAFMMIIGRMKRSNLIPFGLFLIISTFIVQLFGSSLINWYSSLFIIYR